MLKDFFEREKIEYFAELSVKDAVIWDKEKFSRMEEKMGRVESVVLFLIPYYAGQKTTNLSVYAQVKDYHLFVKELSERFFAFLEEKKLDLSFMMMADTSPLAERRTLLLSGLGVLGKNGLVIHEKYGSFFFIGSLFLGVAQKPEEKKEIRSCIGCGACEKACPTGAIFDPERKLCLSLISQKKNLSPEEEKLLKEANCKWGCDLCQNVCPMNQKAEKTPIPFFLEEHISHLTKDVIESGKEAFQSRAFSWRGKKILYRNLEIEE